MVAELAEFCEYFIDEKVGPQPIGFDICVLLNHKGYIVKLTAVVNQLPNRVLSTEKGKPILFVSLG